MITVEDSGILMDLQNSPAVKEITTLSLWNMIMHL
jgi:hypothetical protein